MLLRLCVDNNIYDNECLIYKFFIQAGMANILKYTRVASHLARSDTPGITCIVARLSRSDTPRRSDQWQGSARASGERRWLAFLVVTPHAAPTNGNAPRSWAAAELHAKVS